MSSLPRTPAATAQPPGNAHFIPPAVDQQSVGRDGCPAGLKADEGQGGAVRLIRRFGSAANLNIHLHCLVLDGVYRCGAAGPPAFFEAAAPTDDELHALLQTAISRLMKMLTRRGVLIEDMGQTWLSEPDADGEEARTLRPLQAAAVTYRVAFGPRAGQKVLTLQGAAPREDWVRQPVCADIDGFSLHAAVRVEAHDRSAGELKIIAAILEQPVIEKILTHLGLSPDTNSPVDCLCLAKGPATGRARPARLDPQPPPKGRARQTEQDFAA